MRDKRCPRCGAWMRLVADSVRSVRGGAWAVVRCPECLHAENVFKPRRTEKAGGS